MGTGKQYRCNDCGKEFSILEGEGFLSQGKGKTGNDQNENGKTENSKTANSKIANSKIGNNQTANSKPSGKKDISCPYCGSKNFTELDVKILWD